jgi:carbonic anhydrase
MDGYKTFKATTLARHKDLITHLLEQGHKPTSLVIAGSEMRVSPDLLTSSRPGDLYVIRNIAGLVPPYQETGTNGTIAAIEHAVCRLNVENIVVVSNAYNSAVKTLMADDFNSNDPKDNISQWLSIAADARNAVKEQLAHLTPEEQERACEQEILLVSLRNLLGYPWIMERIEKNQLALYAWYFNIRNGELHSFNPNTGFFEVVG